MHRKLTFTAQLMDTMTIHTYCLVQIKKLLQRDVTETEIQLYLAK